MTESSPEIKVPLSVWIIIINFGKEFAVRISPYIINFKLAIRSHGSNSGKDSRLSTEANKMAPTSLYN